MAVEATDKLKVALRGMPLVQEILFEQDAYPRPCGGDAVNVLPIEFDAAATRRQRAGEQPDQD